VAIRDMERAGIDIVTDPAKITLPGPFTMAQEAKNEFYPDVEAASSTRRS
jgi:methionine synthase II (cobalamin-independent)